MPLYTFGYALPWWGVRTQMDFLEKLARVLCGCKREEFRAREWFYLQELALELSRTKKAETTKNETQLLCLSLAWKQNWLNCRRSKISVYNRPWNGDGSWELCFGIGGKTILSSVCLGQDYSDSEFNFSFADWFLFWKENSSQLPHSSRV